MRAHRTHAMLITSKTTDLAHLAAEHCTRAPYTLPCGLYRCDPDAFGSVESGDLKRRKSNFIPLFHLNCCRGSLHSASIP